MQSEKLLPDASILKYKVKYTLEYNFFVFDTLYDR